MLSKPNFLIVGVARCGTTSLFHYLKQHPEIGFPKIKEPKYFSSRAIQLPHKGPGDKTVDANIITNERTYLNLFKDLSRYQMIGEASSDYFYYHDKTAEAIRHELGDIPIIIVIRNPVERAFSAFSNLVRDGRETLGFEDALKHEKERIDQNFDWMWHYKSGSMYFKGINTFKNVFTKVLVITNDELKSKPKIVLLNIYKFLGVNQEFEANTQDEYSHSGRNRNKIIGMLTSRNYTFTNFIREFVFKLIPRRILEKLASKLLQKDILEKETAQELRSFFLKDIEQVEKIIGKDLSTWK